MSANELELEQAFHAAGKRGLLHCVGENCTFDAGVEQPSHQRYDSAVVEVLLQPRSAAGMPFGRPTSIVRRTVRLSCLPGDRYAWARVMLPLALKPAVARDCYYRISPQTDADDEGEATNQGREEPIARGALVADE